MGLRTAPEVLRKTPDELRVFDFDFSGDEVADGETIASVVSLDVVSPASPSLVGSDPVSSGLVVQALFSGGDEGVEYLVDVQVETTNGQRLQLRGRVVVATP